MEHPSADSRGSKKRTSAQGSFQGRWRAIGFQSRWRAIDVPRKRYTTTPSPTSKLPQEQDAGDDETSQPLPKLDMTLSASRTDPFASYTMPNYAQEAMDHALSFTWPQCLSTDLEKIVIRFRAAWMQLVMESPLVLHTFIFATTKQMLCLRGQKEDDMSQLAVRASPLHQSLALNCARSTIDSMALPTDAMILAIIVLATNGPRAQEVPPQSHPLSPLATTQCRHLFSMLGVVEAHARAVGELVKLKGGLQAVKTFGVRDTILAADIYHSTILGKLPAQTWPDPIVGLAKSDNHILDAEADRMLLHLGSGFAQFDLEPNLGKVLYLMCDLITALDHHVRGGRCPPEMSDIVLQSNTVQNKLLWMRPSKDDMSGNLDNNVRIVANIFSDMVLFPLDPATRVKPRLSAELRRSLKSPILDIEEYGPPSSVFLWILTLGGIAAAFTRHRGWYVEALAEYYGQLLSNHTSLIKRVSAFLWWADVCDQPAKLLWTQALDVYEEEKAAASEYQPGQAQLKAFLADYGQHLETRL